MRRMMLICPLASASNMKWSGAGEWFDIASYRRQGAFVDGLCIILLVAMMITVSSMGILVVRIPA